MSYVPVEAIEAVTKPVASQAPLNATQKQIDTFTQMLNAQPMTLEKTASDQVTIGRIDVEVNLLAKVVGKGGECINKLVNMS
ncbi:type III secretion system inner rod subunit SctI [Candidatus Fukatsuia symbiotica]|uniref:EscI/YscI/HrpB family type III secretion system inner rod protein n=1 Tax=Candidatus Fukatsuia symbiotica TaxID=1878942 RepID=A0A2U8I7S4_9GAMM|nr:type III secretion system inner rod subunit SctI [Candidatus Fukatsuia symbiotica]AWK13994.1 EscI/YscI/HrpB family type III secretion system inner rod protein [Candidatus Fukatsuia symbiotica]MEA9445661.1 type III secretion system inner rod subunit SctI [Candidatus Fukatsuia symbiotica]